MKQDIAARGAQAVLRLRQEDTLGPIDRLFRADGPELLDLDTTPAGVKQNILDDVERITRLLQIYPLLLRTLGRMIIEARRTRRGKPVRIVDVGAGSGGLLFRIEDWAKKRRIAVELTGLDSNEAGVAAARRRAAEEGRRVSFRTGDARALDLGDGAVDLAVTTFMLHHLGPGDAACVLAELDRVSAVNCLAFDLRRNFFVVPALWAFLHLARFDAPTRHDALVSLRRAYSAAELRALLEAARATSCVVEEIPPAFVTVSRA